MGNVGTVVLTVSGLIGITSDSGLTLIFYSHGGCQEHLGHITVIYLYICTRDRLFSI